MKTQGDMFDARRRAENYLTRARQCLIESGDAVNAGHVDFILDDLSATDRLYFEQNGPIVEWRRK